jgi:Na+-driven multidrug efflux pump
VLIALPLSAFLAFQLKNATGIWIGFFAGNTLMGLLSAAAFKKGRWKTVKVDTGADMPSLAE